MNKKTFLFLFLFIQTVLVILSCHKAESCEDCSKINKRPIANAGKDTIITLPLDSIQLDGSLSYDPDGRIQEYSWRGINTAALLPIINKQTEKPTIKNFTQGVYQFELTVNDNSGAFSKDTVTVFVNLSSSNNRPPVADAGSDQTITLPTNSVVLNGDTSTDPDNNIFSYAWTKISGPSAANIQTNNSAISQLTGLVEGVYQFELTVTDMGGLSARDTVKITVNLLPPPTPLFHCGSRPVINVNLIPIGTLSTGRVLLKPGAAGSKILFAGGWTPGTHSSRVDIYDTITKTWSIAELTEPYRDGMAVATVGDKVFFAGGANYDWIDLTSRVDIYNATTNAWSTAELSVPRHDLAAVTLGNKIYFAGGAVWDFLRRGSKVIDIYDNETNSWTTDVLSEGRYELTATAVGNKIYFAGGINDIYNISDKIDVFDPATNTWSASQLNEPKTGHSAVTVNNKIFWGQQELKTPIKAVMLLPMLWK